MHPDENKLAERIVAFLDEALPGRDPDENIQESEQIGKDLLAWLSREFPWDSANREASKTRWDDVLKRVIALAGRAFVDRPHLWSEATHLIEVYFASTWVEDHPAMDQTSSRRQPSGAVLHPVELIAAGWFVKELLLSATSETRTAFYAAIESWDVWDAVSDAIAPIEPTSMELATLFRAFDEYAGHDLARGMVFDKLMSWAGRNPDEAKRAVDGWLEGENGFSSLGMEPVRLLVVAVVNRQGHEPDMKAWRDKVIETLSKRNDEESWKLAALLACLVWPREPEPLVRERHAALLEQIKRFPERLVATALAAMRHDVRKFPAESVETTQQLLQLISQPTRDELSPVVAEIAFLALRRDSDQSVTANFVAPLFPTLLEVTPQDAPRPLGLDAFLARLSRQDATQARKVTGDWLMRHVNSLRKHDAPLSGVLPQLTNRLGPAETAKWIVGFMVSSSRQLREAARYWFVAIRSHSLPIEAFSELDDQQARALAHLLAAGPIAGDIWIPALLQLAISRPQAIDTIRSILLDTAATDYPARCRKLVSSWNEATDDLEGENRDTLTQLRTELEERLDDLEAHHSKRIEIPEIITYRPANDAWWRVQHRKLDAQLRRAAGQSIFQQIATKMPIARGAQMLPSPSQDEPTDLVEHSYSMELPSSETIDRLEAMRSRQVHLKAAADLISQRDREEQP